MFFGIILAVLAIFFIFAYIDELRGGYNNSYVGFAAGFIITLIIGLLVLVCFNGSQLSHRNEMKKLVVSRSIIQARIDSVLSKYTNELAKYPEYEERIHKSVAGGKEKGQLITVPPALRSNETIMEAAKANEKYYSMLCDNRQSVIDQQYAMILNRQIGWWWVPFVIAPTAEDLAPRE